MSFDKYRTVTDLMVYAGLLSEMPSPRQLRRDYDRKIQKLRRSAKETQNSFFRHLEWTSRRDRWIDEMEKQAVACLAQTRKQRTDRLEQLTSKAKETPAVVVVNSAPTVTQAIDDQSSSGVSPPVLPNARPGTPGRRSNQYRREGQRYTPY